MWHELVLHGIGGRTIAEAQQRISEHEFRHWQAYIRRHGTLHQGPRLEHAAALICHTLTASRIPYDDFLPRREVDPVAELEKAMKEWR